MIKPRLLIKPTSLRTRLLLIYGDEELLRATLPPPAQTHERAAPTVCEGLSMWLGRELSVALSVAGSATSSVLGLCDGLGFGDKTLHYEVEVVDPRLRRRGLGSFGDLLRLERRGGAQ